MCIYVHTHIYIYIERERELFSYLFVYSFMYSFMWRRGCAAAWMRQFTRHSAPRRTSPP